MPRQGLFSSGSTGLKSLPRPQDFLLPQVPKGEAIIGEQLEFENPHVREKLIDIPLRFRGTAETDISV